MTHVYWVLHTLGGFGLFRCYLQVLSEISTLLHCRNYTFFDEPRFIRLGEASVTESWPRADVNIQVVIQNKLSIQICQLGFKWKPSAWNVGLSLNRIHSCKIKYFVNKVST